MSEFREGDLVEAVKGDTVIRDRVYEDGDWLDTAARGILNLRRRGFTVTLIERAASALPTEPGVYAPASYFPLHDVRLFKLKSDGSWMEDSGLVDARAIRDLEEWAAEGRLARLEPVPDTARKVLDAVEHAMDKRDWPLSIDDSDAVLAEVAAEFGVTDE